MIVGSCDADHAVNMASRATVNHRAVMPPDAVPQQQQRAAPATTLSNVRAEVSFKRHPFYDVLADIMKPSSLGLPCRVSQTLQRAFF